MDIGLSNSVPILEFAEENIIEIEDICERYPTSMRSDLNGLSSCEL